MERDLATLRAIHLIDTAYSLMRTRGSFVTGDLDWADIFIVSAHRLADFWTREWTDDGTRDQEATRIATLDVLGVLQAMQTGLEEAMHSLTITARFNGADWKVIASATCDRSASAALARFSKAAN